MVSLSRLGNDAARRSDGVSTSNSGQPKEMIISSISLRFELKRAIPIVGRVHHAMCLSPINSLDVASTAFLTLNRMCLRAGDESYVRWIRWLPEGKLNESFARCAGSTNHAGIRRIVPTETLK